MQLNKHKPCSKNLYSNHIETITNSHAIIRLRKEQIWHEVGPDL